MEWPKFVVERGHSERLLLLAEMLGQRVGDAAGKRGSTDGCITPPKTVPFSASPQPFHQPQAQPSLFH